MASLLVLLPLLPLEHDSPGDAAILSEITLGMQTEETETD